MGQKVQFYQGTVTQRKTYQRIVQNSEVVQLITTGQRAALSAPFMLGTINQIYIGRITAESTLRDNATYPHGEPRSLS